MNSKKILMACGVSLLLGACASNPPPVDNDPARARAQAGYDALDREVGVSADETATKSGTGESEGPSMAISNATFKSRPTVLVAPAIAAHNATSIEVIRKNPLAKTAMEVINAYLTTRDYSVVGLESQAQLDEVVQLQSDIAGNDEDLAYVAGLSVGADINITFSGSIQDGFIVIDLNASEASTATLIASESTRMAAEGENQRVIVQKAVQEAIVKLESKVRDRVAADLEKGIMYKVVAHLTGEFTDEQAEEISNMVSSQIRKKFNKMQVISMSRNTFDLAVYVDPNAYDDAQMVYDVFVEGLSGLAKVRKQNITKKLIILEIQ